MPHPWLCQAHFRITGKVPFLSTQHAHEDCFELLWVQEGSGHYLAGDQLYHLAPMTLYLTPAMILHYTKTNRPDRYVRSTLLCRQAKVAQLLSDCGAESAARLLGEQFIAIKIDDPAQAEALDRLFSHAHQIFLSQSDTPPLQFAGELLHALGTLLQSTAGTAVAVQKNTDPLNMALDYINSHLYESVCLEQIAESCHLSKYHLCHRFRSQLGMTVMQYIFRQRHLRAKAALLETDMPVSAIAMENGYSSASHFCSLFRKAEGMTPSAFRAQHR